jgi:hypothetical protein
MKIRYIIILLFITSVFYETQAQKNISEGDTMKFWSVSYIDWPPLWGTPQRQVNAVCKKAGSHCYIFVEDSAPQPTQANLDTLLDRFDNQFYPRLTSLYGPVPDVFDNDSNVFILAMNESNWGGYFDPANQMADTMVYSHWHSHSNQHELIYFAADYFSYAPEMVSHEFGHLLHWQQDHSPEPPVNPVIYWEDAWVDESFSTFAAEYLMNGIAPVGVIHSNAFFASNPDIPLIYFSDYDQVLVWMVFMYEHFGKEQYIKHLISEQANGILGIRKTLAALGYSESFEEVFEQWIVANYIDNATFEGGKYYYSHFNFPSAKYTYLHTVYPTGNKIQTVTPFGADYNVFNATSSKPLTITFSGDSTYKFRLAFMLLNTTTSSVVDVISLQPDAQNNAVFTADSFGLAYNKVVMAVMCVDTLLADSVVAGYSYHAELGGAGITEGISEEKIQLSPNPVNGKLLIHASNLLKKRTAYEITGMNGQLLKKGYVDNGENYLDVSDLKNAEYIFRIVNGNDTISKKFVVQQ